MKTKFLIPLIAGLGLLCACKGKRGGYEAINNNVNTADTVQLDSTSVNAQKLVKTAGIQFKVKNVQQTAQRISDLATTVGGVIIHNKIESLGEKSLDIHISDDSVMRVTSLSTTGNINIKVPTVHLQSFINQIALMGLYVNSQNMDLADKSIDYLSAQLKLKSRSELIAQQKKGRIIIKKPENVLLLKDEMIDQEIDNRRIDDAVKNSIVTLTFYQSNTIHKEVIANDDPSAYNLSVFKRITRSFENGWNMFVDFFVGLVNLWVFIISGFLIWMTTRHLYAKNKIQLAKKPYLFFSKHLYFCSTLNKLLKWNQQKTQIQSVITY